MHISLGPIVIILLVAVLAVIVCRRLHIPPMLGYLLVGFIAGPGLLHLVNQSSGTEFIGEIGITFLMFSIGLEFSLGKLKAMRKLVFGLGSLQVILTLAFTWLILVCTGVQMVWAFTLASAMTMSSTAIVSRIMAEKSELNQNYGHMVMGVLLMQDIAVVPLMILFPAMASGSEHIWLNINLALVKMVFTLLLLLVVGSKIMPVWFRLIARIKSGELFMINVLLVTLGVAYLTQLAGLSLALGAFVAGMLISETQYRFQVEDDIRPFRDILLGFFFITIGMKLDIHVLQSNWRTILLLLALLTLLKAAVLFVISRYSMKENQADSLKTAFYLAQGGEFGFVMLAICGALKLVSPQLEQSAIAAILLSMILAPLLMNLSNWLARKLAKRSWEEQSVDLQTILVETMSKSDHVLIIGFGRCGQSVARILQQENTPYYALDLDAERVATAKSAGEPVTFGDAKRREVLQAAGLKRAQMVLITIHNMDESKHILNNIIVQTPTMPVIVRVTEDHFIQDFIDMGADNIVSDEKESSLLLAGQALMGTGKSFAKVFQIMRRVRRNHYEALEGLFAGSDDDALLESHFYRYAFTLPPDAYLIGKKIEQLPLEKLKIKLLAVRRNAHQLREFEADFQFQKQDTLVLLGIREKIISFENWSLQGAE